MIGEDLLPEIQMLLGHHLAQRLGQFFGGQVRVHALVLVRDDDVDPVRMIADVLVDPLQLDLELLGREADSPQHAETTGLAHRDDDIAAVREREDRELDAELVADGSVHA